MEWYEIPVETLRDRAIEALGCNELDAGYWKSRIVYVKYR